MIAQYVSTVGVFYILSFCFSANGFLLTLQTRGQSSHLMERSQCVTTANLRPLLLLQYEYLFFGEPPTSKVATYGKAQAIVISGELIDVVNVLHMSAGLSSAVTVTASSLLLKTDGAHPQELSGIMIGLHPFTILSFCLLTVSGSNASHNSGFSSYMDE